MIKFSSARRIKTVITSFSWRQTGYQLCLAKLICKVLDGLLQVFFKLSSVSTPSAFFLLTDCIVAFTADLSDGNFSVFSLLFALFNDLDTHRLVHRRDIDADDMPDSTIRL